LRVTDTDEQPIEPPTLNVSLAVESTVQPSVAETFGISSVIRGHNGTVADPTTD
jgi:hypothetical protein